MKRGESYPKAKKLSKPTLSPKGTGRSEQKTKYQCPELVLDLNITMLEKAL